MKNFDTVNGDQGSSRTEEGKIKFECCDKNYELTKVIRPYVYNIYMPCALSLNAQRFVLYGCVTVSPISIDSGFTRCEMRKQ